MVTVISNIVVGVLFCLLILFSFKPINRTDKKLELSKWGKISAVYFFFFFYSGLVYMFLQGRLPLEISIGSVITFGFPIYILYAALKYKLEFNETSIIWFNGAIQRRVEINDIIHISMVKSKNKIVRFVLKTENKCIKLRNDLAIEDIIMNISKKKNIPMC